MEKRIANLSYLTQDFRTSVLENRKNFFAFLQDARLSDKLISDVKKYLSYRDFQANGKELMGEYFPWLLKDLINHKSESFNTISINWLAVYTSISMIDDKLDLESFQDNELTKSVADKVIAQLGTLNLYRIVVGTKYEQLFLDSIVNAANGQSSDVALSFEQNIEEKDRIATEKNHLLFALSGAIAATTQHSPEKADFILQFTKNMLVTVQHLDDISDYSEDFAMNKMTSLLSGINLKVDLSTDEKIVEELVVSGSLENTLKKVIISNNKVLNLISSGSDFINNNSKAIPLFRNLHTSLVEIEEYIKNWKKNDDITKDEFIKELLKKLDNVALAS